jgi:phage terminase large subunit-like protein
MPWRPSVLGEVPTLGYQVLDWISENLAAPDRAQYQPFILYPEQARFLLQWYELDPITGHRRYTRGVLCRPRGWGKSPLLAAICCVEALGPVRFDGWDADGQPVGVPWMLERTPLIQVAAVSEIQTKNTWSPLLEMLVNGPAVDNYRGLEPMNTFVVLPTNGRIEPVTSSARSVKGNRAVFAVLDQSEEWIKSNGGVSLADTMRINAAKVDGTTLESPNAFIPGEGSVAEGSKNFADAIRDGRAKDDSLLYDHREAPGSTKLYEPASLRKGLIYVYGDSAKDNGGHVDIDRLIATIQDPTLDPQVARADFLNQIRSASDAWLRTDQWKACNTPDRQLQDGDAVTLGFDGSRNDDSTALVACRLDDGHLEVLACWEKPDDRLFDDDDIGGWEVDREEVDSMVHRAMDRFQVVGFYADPAQWQDYVDRWTRLFGRKMRVGLASRPLEWWTGQRPTEMAKALERFHTAVLNQELSFTGDENGDCLLTRHVLNARRKVIMQGVHIRKAFAKSPKKIDAAMAAVLAYEARNDAVAKRVKKRRASGFFVQTAV